MRVSTKAFLPKGFVFIFALVIFSMTAGGQVPTDDTIRVSTDLVQTNVVVMDKNGKFVDGLKTEQFELKIDGKPTKIEFFEGKFAVKQAENAQSNTNPKTAVTNPVTSLRERKIMFFIDDFHLSLDSLGRTRSAIHRFIDYDMLPRDNVAIITASGQLGFLQQFTDNKAVLRAALDRLKVVPNTVKDTEQPGMPDYIALRIVNGDRDAAEVYVQKIIEGYAVKDVTTINRNAAFEMVKQRANNVVRGFSAVAENMLGSLENVFQMLSQMNGQKQIFFISDGFLLQSKNVDFVSNNRFQQILNLATRSGSKVYTIDARGLFSLAPDATNDRPIETSGASKSRVGEDTAAQEGLFVLADKTGGRFLKNQNYFDKWVDKMLDENASYYILAWTPETETQADKQFKQVEVSVVGRPDLTVRLQRGYLANWKKPEVKKDTTTGSTTTVTPLTLQNQTSKVIPAILSLSYLDVPNSGAVLTSSVQIMTEGLTFGADGKQSAAVDLAGIILNSDGKQVADFKTGLNITPPAVNASGETTFNASQGVIYNDRKTLAPGIYQVKVAVKERQTGMIGSAVGWVEIPDLTKRKLTLGSLFLEAQEVKKADGSGNMNAQVQFSVDHRFKRPFKLSFLTFIYNAAKADANPSGVNLATQIEIFDAQGRAVVNAPMRPLVIKEMNDAGRIPVSGSIRQDTLAPGVYLLRITVNDVTAKTTAVQQTLFTVE